ncbi:MAG: putative Monomeric sarcosine oxidase [Ilumatobacteraceae bacterium]|nr:putative Monomeric sarcosine oxidase [Ilumatobacteraceae bacterium]
MAPVDVIIIGGGVMGSSTAWWLARRGRSVVLLERYAQGHRNGSSHGTERIFRLTNADPFWCRHAVAALPLWRELEADTESSLFLTTGHIDYDTTDQLQLRFDAAAAAGVRTHWLAPEALAERWPGMSADRPVLFHPEGGRTNAQATIDAMVRRAAELGADVRYETPALAVRQLAEGVEVRTESETLTAGCVVVATAGWTPYVLDGQVPGLPTVDTSTGQVAFFQPHDPDATWPTFVAPEVYGMSTPDGRVRVGHFQHSEPVPHPDQRTFVPDPATRAEIERWVGAHVPGVDPHHVDELSCLFGETIDDDYIVDRCGDIVVGCGFGGTGFKFAPLVGRMLADLACGQPGPGGRFALGRP